MTPHRPLLRRQQPEAEAESPPSPSQHSFPHDYRSGPSPLDWDPSKWAIALLDALGLASGLRRAHVDEVAAAREHMIMKEKAALHGSGPTAAAVDGDSDVGAAAWSGEVWTRAQLAERAQGADARCLLFLGGYAVDATEYAEEHVRVLLRPWCPAADALTDRLADAFHDARPLPPLR